MSTRPETLQAVRLALWAELQRAADSRDHAWRTMTLATHDGLMAHARSVILREVDAAAQTLLFFSDARSPKVAQLREHPLGTLQCWSAALGWQLRLAVHLQARTEGLAVSSRWARVKLSPAAQDYMAPLAPGESMQAIGEVLPQHSSRHHFAVVTAAVRSIDWLELHPQSHRRARLDGEGAAWLQP